MLLTKNKLEILPRVWYWKEPDTEEKDIINIYIPDYKQEYNHFCKIHVEYKNHLPIKYIGRVVYNEIKNYWTIDGAHIAVKVLC